MCQSNLWQLIGGSNMFCKKIIFKSRWLNIKYVKVGKDQNFNSVVYGQVYSSPSERKLSWKE